MWLESSACELATMSLLLLLLLFLRAEASEQQQPQEGSGLLQGPAQLFGLDFGGPPEPSEQQQLPMYQIGKRARKMSAFMPMRGRKDGRDEQLVQFRELDPDSPSILRLVAGGGLGGQRLAGQRLFAAALRRAADGSSPAEGADEPIMDAKLRRAFHPMRGKKWAPQAEASGPEPAYDGLELGEM